MLTYVFMICTTRKVSSIVFGLQWITFVWLVWGSALENNCQEQLNNDWKPKRNLYIRDQKSYFTASHIFYIFLTLLELWSTHNNNHLKTKIGRLFHRCRKNAWHILPQYSYIMSKFGTGIMTSFWQIVCAHISCRNDVISLLISSVNIDFSTRYSLCSVWEWHAAFKLQIYS